jgi:hypothetical protein
MGDYVFTFAGFGDCDHPRTQRDRGGKALSCASGSGSAICILTGMNPNAIGSGVVAYINATIASRTTTASIQRSNQMGVDPIGNGLPVVASQGFRSADGALNSIAGYEAMNIIRKDQIRWLPKGDVVGQKRFIERIFGIAACHI